MKNPGNWFGLITLFPEMFSALQYGVTGRAIKEKRVTLAYCNPRDFAKNKHKTIDDRPYGGGPGQVMLSAPLLAAIEHTKAKAPTRPTVIYLSPQGQSFNQTAAKKLASNQALILIAGRYEGIDQRVIDSAVDEEWSIGDYILTGGELAAMVMIDAIARFIPGTLGNLSSAHSDSFNTGLLKYPQYTRDDTEDASIPEVLLTGHHQHIDRWRLKQSLGKTWLKRPDLLIQRGLSQDELVLLSDFIREFKQK